MNTRSRYYARRQFQHAAKLCRRAIARGEDDAATWAREAAHWAARYIEMGREVDMLGEVILVRHPRGTKVLILSTDALAVASHLAKEAIGRDSGDIIDALHEVAYPVDPKLDPAFVLQLDVDEGIVLEDVRYLARLASIVQAADER